MGTTKLKFKLPRKRKLQHLFERTVTCLRQKTTFQLSCKLFFPYSLYFFLIQNKNTSQIKLSQREISKVFFLLHYIFSCWWVTLWPFSYRPPADLLTACCLSPGFCLIIQWSTRCAPGNIHQQFDVFFEYEAPISFLN